MKNIGIIGGGQLGKMIAISAKEMGNNTIVLDPNPDSPAFGVSDEKIIAEYDDINACDMLVDKSDIITYEFENIKLGSVKYIEKYRKVFPSSKVLSISQNRILEKDFVVFMPAWATPFSPLLNLSRALVVCSVLLPSFSVPFAAFSASFATTFRLPSFVTLTLNVISFAATISFSSSYHIPALIVLRLF